MSRLTFIQLRNLSGGSATIEPNSLIDCGGGVQIAGHGAGGGLAAISRTTDSWVATETTTKTWTGYERVKLHRRPSGRILALVSGGGTGGGAGGTQDIWYSDDTGSTWTLAQVLCIAANNSGGQPSQPWSKSTGGFLCVCLWEDVGGAFGDVTGKFWTSANDGLTWTEAAYQFPGGSADNGGGLTCLETLSATTAIFGTSKVGTLTTVDIFRTTDNFATATSVFNAASGNFVSLIDLTNGNILAGRRGPYLLRSTNVGATWTQIADLTALLGASGEPSVLSRLSAGVVGLGGQVQPAGFAIAATSEDGGVTWTRDDNTLAPLNGSTVLTAIIRADDGLVYGGGWSEDIVYRAPWVFGVKQRARGYVV